MIYCPYILYEVNFDFLKLSNIYYFYDGSRTGCSMASFYLLKNIIGGFEMIEIGKLGELDRASHYPQEVQEKILEAVEIFADEYGEDRDYKVRGGYVAIIESLEEFKQFEVFSLDFMTDEIITEYQDVLANGDFVSSLILLGDDYNLLLITPKEYSDFEKVRSMLLELPTSK